METVDFSVLNEFKTLMGDEGEQEVKELVHLYLADGPVQLQTMKASLDSRDSEGFQRAAHSFKSSCGNIGAMSLQALCFELEQKAAAGHMDKSCVPLLSQAVALFSDVKVLLNDYVAS